MDTGMLASLSKWKQLAFVANIADRLLPNFAVFSKETGFGDPPLLAKVLGEIWERLEHSDRWPDAGARLQKCEGQAPDTEDFDSLVTSAALDAVSVICMCLEGFQEDAVQYEQASQLALDTIDLYSQFASESKALDDHPEQGTLAQVLLSQELADQRAAVEVLCGDGGRAEVLQNVRALSRPQGSLGLFNVGQGL